MRQILRGRAVIGLLCAVPIAYLAISLSGPALERYRAERRERAAKEHAKQQVLETWNAAAFVPLDAASAEQLTEEIAEAVEDRGPALAQLRADQREALGRVLKDQLLARAASADAYVSLAAADAGARWIGPDDAADWQRSRKLYERRMGRAPEGSDPGRWLEEFVREEMTAGRHRLVGVAAGPEGSRIMVFRVRALEQVGAKIGELMTEDEVKLWFNNEGQAAARFRVPLRSIDDVIAAEGSALVAFVNMLVRAEDGCVFNWHGIWYWDAEAASWQCEVMARKGWHGFMFY